MCRKFVPTQSPFLPSLKGAGPKGLPMWSRMRQPIMTKYERALVRRSVKCSICIPIFSAVEEWKLPSMSRNQPLAVVALDTDEDILGSLQGNQVLLNLIIEATSGISALMTERRRNDV